MNFEVSRGKKSENMHDFLMHRVTEHFIINEPKCAFVEKEQQIDPFQLTRFSRICWNRNIALFSEFPGFSREFFMR